MIQMKNVKHFIPAGFIEIGIPVLHHEDIRMMVNSLDSYKFCYHHRLQMIHLHHQIHLHLHHLEHQLEQLILNYRKKLILLIIK